MKVLGPILFIAMIVAIVAWFMMPRPRVWEEKLTLHEAIHEYHLGLPPSASNILFATASVGLGGRATVYRFTAPVSNMLEHVNFMDSTLDYPRNELTPPPYHPIITPVEMPPLESYGLDKLEWFDIQNIRTGFVSHVDGPNSTIWIDAERQLYFYHWSD
jgi:hypothetical protein